MKKLISIIISFFLTTISFSSVGISQNSIKLSSKNQLILGSIENYLNKITTLEARFVQVSSNGDHYEGVLKLSRPGHLRIDYNPPYPVVILADSSYLSYFDTELRQVSNIDVDETPLAILLKEKFTFSSSGVVLQNFKNKNGVIQITIFQKNNPQNGKLTLIFSENPIELRKWTILDARNISTNVALVESIFGGHIPEKTFIFELPKVQDNTR